MRKKYKSEVNQTGFTLIELLLVIGLLAISVGVTSDILLNLVRSYNKIQVFNEIEQQSNFVIQKIEKEVRNATSINTANSNSTQIVLNLTTGDVLYRVSSGRIQRILYPGGYGTNPSYSNFITFQNQAGNTFGGVTVTCPSNVCFEYLGTNPTRLKYEFIFNQSQVGALQSEAGGLRLFNYIVLRRTY